MDLMDSMDMHAAPLHRPGRRWSAAPVALAAALAPWVPGGGRATADTPTVLQVGPGQQYATPCQAIQAAPADATIEIDAAGNGSYDGDVCAWSANNLTIVGVNGRARIDAAGQTKGDEGTWVIKGKNTTVENVELSGAADSARNGAGIRLEGSGLTVRHSYFHDNQEGILTNDSATSDIVIEASEFARNGDNGTQGAAHNMYIGRVRSFTLRDSYSHDANQGHLVKSRAAVNYILYNRLTDEAGSSSRELDLPNGGLSYVIGNVLQKGPHAQNPYLLSYGEEGASNPDARLYAVNNTFVDNRGSGAAIQLDPATAADALVQKNISVGSPTFVDQAGATLTTNCLVPEADARFVDPSAYDYHLQAGSPCIDAGSAAGVSAEGYALTPAAQYVYDTAETPRAVVGAAIDAGAFEYGNTGNTATATNTPTSAPVATDTPTSAPVATDTPTSAPPATDTPTSSAGVTAGTTYTFANRGVGKCIDNTGGSAQDGNPVQIWACDPGNQNQRWTAVANGINGDGSYQLVNALTGKCLDNTDGSAQNGNRLQQWTCDAGNQNQAWRFVDTGRGDSLIQNAGVGSCVDNTDGSAQDGNRLQIWACDPGNQNQGWRPAAD